MKAEPMDVLDRARPFVEVKGLQVNYHTRGGERLLAVGDMDFQLWDGEFCVIVGPSGCGKSTLLKVLAGLVQPTGGEGRVGTEPMGRVRDDIGFVFQSATLLPWLNILGNVLLPLRVQGRKDKHLWEAKARELLQVVGLGDFADRYPSELSGGMQQRVGMARALVHDPALLLMDEPFGALDALTRETMNAELQRIWLLQRKSVVFVTHSISEAVFLADRVIVMSARPGRVLADLRIDLPRPRDLVTIDSGRFADYSREVRSYLYRKEGA
ncbi:MAG TPA: ABC transporter ATP-binding protein [Ramlibacter sp.]|nr:ABC transporter ATP-binding protein [Ramlibacter sp.]